MRLVIDQDRFAQAGLWLDDTGGFHALDTKTGEPLETVLARVLIEEGAAVFFPRRSAAQRVILTRLGEVGS